MSISSPERQVITMNDEFRSLESYPDIQDRLEAASVLLEEYLDGHVPEQIRDWGRPFEVTSDSSVQHYALLEIGRDLQRVERMYDKRNSLKYHSMFRTEDYMYGRVEQQGIWILPPDQPYYVRSSMDQCSLIASVRSDGYMMAAHLGYSERSGLRAVFDLMKEEGFSPKDTVAVVATHQHHAMDAAAVPDYVQAGIPADNILTFHSVMENGSDDGSMILKNASEVILTPGALLAQQVDVTILPDQNRTEIKGLLHDQSLIDMRPDSVGQRL